MEFIPFNKIASWGINNQVAVIVFEKSGEFIKFYFDTLQVRVKCLKLNLTVFYIDKDNSISVRVLYEFIRWKTYQGYNNAVQWVY